MKRINDLPDLNEFSFTDNECTELRRLLYSRCGKALPNTERVTIYQKIASYMNTLVNESSCPEEAKEMLETEFEHFDSQANTLLGKNDA